MFKNKTNCSSILIRLYTWTTGPNTRTQRGLEMHAIKFIGVWIMLLANVFGLQWVVFFLSVGPLFLCY